MLKLFDEPQKAFVSDSLHQRKKINERLERKKYNLSKWIQARVLKGTPEVQFKRTVWCTFVYGIPHYTAYKL